MKRWQEVSLGIAIWIAAGAAVAILVFHWSWRQYAGLVLYFAGFLAVAAALLFATGLISGEDDGYGP